MYSTVEVHSCPRADFGYQANQLDVAFGDSSFHATGYFWDFGNGDTSSSQNPVEHYTTGGNYQVMFVARNPYCNDTLRKDLYIDSCPAAHFAYQLTARDLHLAADTTNTVVYDWHFGDGDSIMVYGNEVDHSFQQNGSYTVILTVTNLLGCRSVDTITVNVAAVGINNVANGNLSINCNGTTGCAINNTSTEKYQVELVDAVGRVLFKTQVTGSYFLPTESYAQGIYFVRLHNEFNTVVRKFVKR